MGRHRREGVRLPLRLDQPAGRAGRVSRDAAGSCRARSQAAGGDGVGRCGLPIDVARMRKLPSFVEGRWALRLWAARPYGMVDAAFATPLLLTLTSAKPRRCHPTGVSLPWPISHTQLRTLPV